MGKAKVVTKGLIRLSSHNLIAQQNYGGPIWMWLHEGLEFPRVLLSLGMPLIQNITSNLTILLEHVHGKVTHLRCSACMDLRG